MRVQIESAETLVLTLAVALNIRTHAVVNVPEAEHIISGSSSF